MPEAIGNVPGGVPVTPNSGGVEETTRKDRPVKEEIRKEDAKVEDQRQYQKDAAAAEIQTGRKINTAA